MTENETALQTFLRFTGLQPAAENLGAIMTAPATGVAAGKFDKKTKEIGARQRQIMADIRRTTDPKKKQQLLEESRKLSTQLERGGAKIRNITDIAQRASGIDEEDLQKSSIRFALEQGGKQTAGLASLAVPFGKTAQAAKAVAPTALARVGGSLTGRVAPGAADAALQRLSEGDAGVGDVTSATVGGGVAAGLLGPLAAAGKRLMPSGDQARKLFGSAFTIPKRVLGQSINIDKMSDAMVKYNISGSLEQLGKVASRVTGRDGVITKALNEALGQVTTRVNAGDAALSAKQAFSKATNVDDRIKNNTIKQVANTIDPSGNMSRLLDQVTDLESRGASAKAVEKLAREATDLQVNPKNIWKAVTDLEKKGHEILQSSVSRDRLDPTIAARQQAQIYLDAANALKKQIDESVVGEGVLDAVKKQFADQVKSINPRLAADFTNVRTMQELRSLAKPFVDLDKSIRSTQRTLASEAGESVRALRGFNPINPATYPRAIESLIGREGLRTGLAVGGEEITQLLSKLPPEIGQLLSQVTTRGAARGTGSALQEPQATQPAKSQKQSVEARAESVSSDILSAFSQTESEIDPLDSSEPALDTSGAQSTTQGVPQEEVDKIMQILGT